MDLFNGSMEQYLYEYSGQNKGCFLGNPQGNFPQCQMVLNCNNSIMVVGPVGIMKGRESDSRVVSNYMAQTPVSFGYPFHLEIRPKNLIHKGLEVVFKNSVEIKVPVFDKKYFIKTDRPEFVRQVLPGSPFSLMLVKTKFFRIVIEPVAEESNRHTLQVICLKNLQSGQLFGVEPEPEDISTLVDLCRLASEAFLRFPMEPEGKDEYQAIQRE